MKRPLAVIDTNVIVSALISGDSQALVSRIFDGMLSAEFVYLLSPDLLDEYRSVLLRPKIQKLHGLTAEEIDRILGDIVMNGIWREPTVAFIAPDPGDNHLWGLLAAQKGSMLVTGDRLLLENPPDFASVISPRSFLTLLNRL